MNIYNEDSILYLGFALPSILQNEVEKIDDYPHFATNKFSHAIVKSLKYSFKNVLVISTAEIRNYPTVKKIFFKNSIFTDNKINGYFIGFTNIILIKHFTRFFNLIPIGNKTIKQYKIKHVLVHGTHTPFMLYAILVKYFFNVNISIILTDEHGLEVSSDGILGKLFRNIDKWVMNKMIKSFDTYICLSQAFVSKFELKNSLILPGIVNSHMNLASNSFQNKKSSYFKIVFAGGLNMNNGVDVLLKAISLTNLEDVRFHILGKGDLMQDVILASKNDHRIIYEGVKHASELVESLLSADLLINPRPIKLDSSRFSFPSKLLEYMSSGVPILTTKLECLPSEFHNCLYFTYDDSASAISNEIVNLFHIPAKDRNTIGENAKKISTKHYGEDAIGSKIYSLLTRKSNEV